MTNFGLLAPFRRAHRDSVVSKVARRICFKIMHMFMWMYDGAKDTLLNSERMMIFVTKPIHFSKICIILSSLPHLGVDLLPANFVGFVDSICTVYEPRRPICLFSEALGNGCNCSRSLIAGYLLLAIHGLLLIPQLQDASLRLLILVLNSLELGRCRLF